jgi:Phage tail sheath C-terminal domain
MAQGRHGALPTTRKSRPRVRLRRSGIHQVETGHNGRMNEPLPHRPAIEGLVPTRIDTSDPDWKYVDVRRLLVYLEHSLDQGLQWAVFEPNDEPLWASVRDSVSDFLLAEWRSGALKGERPEQAFFVRCDRTTMTQDDLDNGRLVVVVGVATVRPAEFVVFQIGQWTCLNC